MPMEKREMAAERESQECLERLYREIGISAVAAAVRCQRPPKADGVRLSETSVHGEKSKSHSESDKPAIDRPPRRKARRAA